MEKTNLPYDPASTVIIACEVLRDEVELAMANTGCTLPVVWGGKGLHRVPDNLRAGLNEMIAGQPEAETILLAYGLCGNGMIGVGSGTATVVVPRFDDCIWMLLCGQQGKRPPMDIHSLYYTRGYLENDNVGQSALPDDMLYCGYLRTVEKYGPEKAKKVYRRIFANYESITMLDTGAYKVEDCLAEAKSFADDLELELHQQAGSVRVLEKLFAGPWDEEICITGPGEVFLNKQFEGFLANCEK